MSYRLQAAIMVSSATLFICVADTTGIGGGPVGRDSFTNALEDELDALLAADIMSVLIVVVVSVLLMPGESRTVTRSDARSSASISSNSSAVCWVATSLLAAWPFRPFSCEEDIQGIRRERLERVWSK